MKFCKNCGTQLEDAVAFCPQCGATCEQPQQQAYQQPQQPQQQAYQQQAYQQPYQQPYAPAPRPISGLATAAKILMIVSTVVMGLYLFPLAWCIPMVISYNNKLKNGEPVSIAFKICTLLFVNTIAGVLMLCDKD